MGVKSMKSDLGGLLISRRGSPTIPLWWCPEIANDRQQAKLPKAQPKVALSEQIVSSSTVILI
jgi:hypothetical protein